MWEHTRAHKTRKWTDKEFTEGADYNYKRYFIPNKNFSARKINNDCKQDVAENTEIVTFDVISLYTSIPHEFGLEGIDYFLAKYQGDLIQDLERYLF